MLQKDTFKDPCCCFENVPNTALTIVCTIYVSIDYNGFDVPNLTSEEKYTQIKIQDNEMLGLCLFLKIIVCKDDDFSAFRATKSINENFGKMY